MTTDSNPSEATQAPAVVVAKVLRWSAQSSIRLFLVYSGALAAVLVVVALKAFAWGLRFHLIPGYWSGVYQQHPVAVALIFAGVSVCISIIGAATVFVLRRKRAQARAAAA